MSRHIGRLSIRQAEFLRALRDNPETMQQVIERYKTKPWILTGWLRRRQFRDALAEAMWGMRRRARLELDMAYAYAIHLLAGIVRGAPGNHLIRQTAFDLVVLRNQILGRKRRGGKGAGAKNPSAPKPADETAADDALIERRVGRKAPPLNPGLSEAEQVAIITRLRVNAGLLPPPAPEAPQPPDTTDA